MSIQALNWALSQDSIDNSGARFVLLVLCNYANEVGQCYPSRETIAKKTSMSVRSVQTHINWLAEHGYLTWTNERNDSQRQTPNVYQLTKPSAESAPRDEKPSANIAEAECKLRQKPSAKSAQYTSEENHQENHQEIRDAWTGKPRDIESPNCPSSPEINRPTAEIFVGTVLASVTKELGLTKLSVTAQRDWSNHALLAFENNFTPEQFLECFRLLRGQTWRNSPVQPKHVMDGLPELAKLRREGKQNGSTEKLPTLAEKLADDQANRQNLRKAPTAI